MVGEELPCQRERVNLRDPFAVVVLKDEAIVAGVMAVLKGPWGDGSVSRGCRYR